MTDFHTENTRQNYPIPLQPENPLAVFDNPEFGSVRVTQRDDGLWFVAADVCAALDIANSRDAVASLDDDERDVATIDTLGGKQTMTLVSEPGLYSLILRSRKPEARVFKRWITHEVIPSIRKHGSYALPNFNSPIEAAEAWIAAEKARLAAEDVAVHAIRTKAEIGSRREATSMATASAAVRKNHALEDTLGIGRNYRQVKAVEWLAEEFLSLPGMYSQVGKKISELSARMGYPTRMVPDEKYPGGVKSYHVDVVDAFRALLRTDLNMLAKFRRR